MNKVDIIKKVSESAAITKVDAALIVDVIFDTIINEIKTGGKVAITGFGSFEVKDRASRKGINPQTKEEILIPAGKKVSFKTSSSLKEKIN